MKDYLKDISDMILDANNADLTLLRWLASYHLKLLSRAHTFSDAISYNWVDTKRHEMKQACWKCKIVDEESGDDFSDLEYAQKIYKYGQSIIMEFARNRRASLSEYSVLLYIYTLAITSNNQRSQYSKANQFGKCLLKNVQSLCERPSISEDTGLVGDFSKRSAVDRLIFVLYLWIADFGVLRKYNEKICKLSNSSSYQIDADKIYKDIHELPSKFKYFYENKKRSPETEKTIRESFVSFLLDMPPTAVPFAPSIITIFFNTLLPTKIARAKEIDFHYVNLIREIPCGERLKKKAYKKFSQKIKFPQPDDSSFLKMLILPETSEYDKNKKNRIESRFKEYEWECFCKIYQDLYKQAVGETSITFYHGWNRRKIKLKECELCISDNDVKYYEENIKNYIGEEKIRTPTPEEYNNLDKKYKYYMMKAMRNHSFTFTYGYFEMFYKLVENKQLFPTRSTPPVDIALSMIHLNTFTKWYDAVLLHKGMDFRFLQCNYFFYLKLLTIYEKYTHFVADISFIDRNILYGLAAQSIKKTYRKTNINIEDTFDRMLEFFSDTAEKKINSPKLMNIFKANNRTERCESSTLGGFDPIYQWIKLLDDKDLEESFFDDMAEKGPITSMLW